MGNNMINGYTQLNNGLIKQIEHIKFTYNRDYIKNRNLGELDNYMSYLRYSYIIGALGYIPKSLLDIGYGSGSFLKLCSEKIQNCYGNDISGYAIPDKCNFLKFEEVFEKTYDIVCFFDSLEHFEDIYFVKNLKTQYIIISLPHCHYFSDEWFTNWKHRKPNEHLWHFNPTSLELFMIENGYALVQNSYVEDIIRKNPEYNNNILTALYKKI